MLGNIRRSLSIQCDQLLHPDSGGALGTSAEAATGTMREVKIPEYKKGNRQVVDAMTPLNPITSNPSAEIRLQNVAKELKKVRKPKINNLKGGYSTNGTLILKSWLNDIEMCVTEGNPSNGEVIQLLKDFTSDQARNAVAFYYNMTPINQEHY